MHVALFLGSSIRQSGRLLTARFEVQVLAEEQKETCWLKQVSSVNSINSIFTFSQCLRPQALVYLLSFQSRRV